MIGEMAVEQARVSRLQQLLAEDLLLLSLKPSGAVRREARRSLGPALCGAVLVELVDRGQVLGARTVELASSAVRSTRMFTELRAKIAARAPTPASLASEGEMRRA